MPKDPFVSGQLLTAALLNEIIGATVAKVEGGNGTTTQRFGRKVIVTPTIPFTLPVTRRQMSIVSDQGDYLICKTLDANGVLSTGTINVLKPHLLRRTPFENLTVNGVAYTYQSNSTRTADGTESQIITQDYYVGAVITVVAQNVSVQVTPGVFTNLLDANDNSREWTEVA